MKQNVMNIEDKYKRIRGLLALYYDGATTPEQAGELEGLFLTTEPLPADLKTEREVFFTIEARRYFKNAAIHMPEDLEERLSKAIDSFEQEAPAPDAMKIDTARTARGFFHRLAVGVAAAAVVVVTLTLGWKAMNIVGNTPDLDVTAAESPMASARPSDTPDDSAETKSNSTEPINEASAQSEHIVGQSETPKPIIRNRQKNSPKIAYTTPSKSKKGARIREITDPEEARIFIDQVQTKIRKNINQAEIAACKSEDIIESFNRNINNVDL